MNKRIEKALDLLRITTPRRKWNIIGAFIGGLLGYTLGALTGHSVAAVIGFLAFAYIGYRFKKTLNIAKRVTKEFRAWFIESWFYEFVWEYNPGRITSYVIFSIVLFFFFSLGSSYWSEQNITWSQTIFSGQFQYHLSACAYNYNWMLEHHNRIFAHFIFWLWGFCSACIGIVAAYMAALIKILVQEFIKENLTTQNLNLAIKAIIAFITQVPIMVVKIILFIIYELPVQIFQLLIKFITTLHNYHRLACGIYATIGCSGFLLIAPLDDNVFLTSGLAIVCGLIGAATAHVFCLIEESASCRNISRKIIEFQPKSIYPWVTE